MLALLPTLLLYCCVCTKILILLLVSTIIYVYAFIIMASSSEYDDCSTDDSDYSPYAAWAALPNEFYYIIYC